MLHPSWAFKCSRDPRVSKCLQPLDNPLCAHALNRSPAFSSHTSRPKSKILPVPLQVWFLESIFRFLELSELEPRSESVDQVRVLSDCLQPLPWQPSWSPTHKKPRSQQKLVCPLLVCPHPRVQDGQGLAAKAHLVPCSGRLGYPLSCPSSPEKWSLTWRSSVSVSVLGLVFLRIIFLIHLGLRPWKKGGIKWLPSLKDTEVFSPSLARIFGQISQLRPCRCILCELEPYGSWGSSPQYSEPSRTGVRLLSPISK